VYLIGRLVTTCNQNKKKRNLAYLEQIPIVKFAWKRLRKIESLDPSSIDPNQ
jgi:hypothetical protein